LAERDDVGEGRLVEPATPLDEFGAKIAEMRHRSAERSQSQAKKDPQYLRHRAALGLGNRRRRRARCGLDLGCLLRHSLGDGGRVPSDLSEAEVLRDPAEFGQPVFVVSDSTPKGECGGDPGPPIIFTDATRATLPVNPTEEHANAPSHN